MDTIIRGTPHFLKIQRNFGIYYTYNTAKTKMCVSPLQTDGRVTFRIYTLHSFVQLRRKCTLQCISNGHLQGWCQSAPGGHIVPPEYASQGGTLTMLPRGHFDHASQGAL